MPRLGLLILGLAVLVLAVQLPQWLSPVRGSQNVEVDAKRSPGTLGAPVVAPLINASRLNPAARLERPVFNPRIVIRKSLRRLDLYSGDQLVRQYTVALGRQPVGDKEREGDGRTPEGEYYIAVKNPNSRYHRALGLSYPNADDARRGLELGLIDQEMFDRIAQANRFRRLPPWYTALGGEVLIYGGGINGDWTSGSISLRPEDIEELFTAVPEGAPVTILP